MQKKVCTHGCLAWHQCLHWLVDILKADKNVLSPFFERVEKFCQKIQVLLRVLEQLCGMDPHWTTALVGLSHSFPESWNVHGNHVTACMIWGTKHMCRAIVMTHTKGLICFYKKMSIFQTKNQRGWPKILSYRFDELWWPCPLHYCAGQISTNMMVTYWLPPPP